ncbi:MAG: beta-ketoacyl synthase [Rhodospirillaceae bacterium]|jgi:3-oxoacyl-(acyl-carrier-protein) synthase|nr:beta-ketoacyl synthase [Rhodospirillaceae bacterium]|tara:strand:+ start:12748 stop:13938 length:1191 start_codon:yes stop_codon:yes gene_type:complete
MNSEKIFITGLGITSALGNSLDETFQALINNKINVGKIDSFESKIDKPVFKSDISKYKISKESMRTKQLADVAFYQALKNADISEYETEKKSSSYKRIGICCGTTVASQLNDIEFYTQLRAGKAQSYDPVKLYLKSNISEALVSENNFSGPGINIVNACSSGTDAIGIAMSWLRSGICDIAIAGGADELNHVPYAGFNSLGILSDSQCRPFDKDRDGLNLGEGAAFLVLEKESSALARKTEILAECCSYATSSDAYHLTAPRPDGLGLRTAITKALTNAKLDTNKIDFINAHGTATKNNDLAEGLVFNNMFSNNTKVLSTKGYTGHTLGAAGAIDAVLTILSLKKQWLPKNRGFSNQDPEINFSPVAHSTEYNAEYAMSTSLAFGGMNSAVIFRRI